jgi:periplasmic protein TonB
VGRLPAPAYYVMSAAVHAGVVCVFWAQPSVARRVERLDVQIVETAKPRRVEPNTDAVASPVVSATPVTAARARTIRHVALVAAPSRSEPPPAMVPTTSSADPVAPAIQASTAPLRLGISLSSASIGGAFVAPVGSGGAGRSLAIGGESAGHELGPISRATDVTVLPQAINAEIPKNEYPTDALAAGFEGTVTLKIVVDAAGRVRRATILKDPGYGLGAAAVRIATRYFRFKPGQRGGHPVATEIPFTVYFELP